MNDNALKNAAVGQQQMKKGRRRRDEAMPFTKNFNALIKEHGLTMRKVAEICGVSPSMVAQWSTGSLPSDVRCILRLCDHTGADFQNLMTGVPSPARKLQSLSEMFDLESSAELSGLFLVEAKRLKIKK